MGRVATPPYLPCSGGRQATSPHADYSGTGWPVRVRALLRTVTLGDPP
jgi:hypothetical protein